LHTNTQTGSWPAWRYGIEAITIRPRQAVWNSGAGSCQPTGNARGIVPSLPMPPGRARSTRRPRCKAGRWERWLLSSPLLGCSRIRSERGASTRPSTNGQSLRHGTTTRKRARIDSYRPLSLRPAALLSPRAVRLHRDRTETGTPAPHAGPPGKSPGRVRTRRRPLDMFVRKVYERIDWLVRNSERGGESVRGRVPRGRSCRP